MGSLKDSPRKDVGGNNGRSVDIYLFSNGQRDSPPRKYNVRVDDRWDTTLKLLARSQNGSDHTIEVYTTNGTKIAKPQDLSNGGAYVAVEPPQQFIPSGYNEYLMKASKSREKRLEKSPEEKVLIKPDTIISEHKTDEQTRDGTNIKIIQDITIRPTSRTAVNEQDATSGKVKPATAKTVKPFGRINNKQIPKKNNSQPQSIPNSLKKNMNNVTPPVTRKSNRKEGTPPFQATKINPITKTVEKRPKSDVAGVITIMKSDQENTETAEAYDLLKYVDTAVVSHNSYHSITGFKTIQKATTDSTLIERSILLPVSPRDDPPTSKHAILVNNASKLNLLSNISDPDDVELIPGKLKSSPATGIPLAKFAKENDTSNIKTTELIEEQNKSEKNVLIVGNQTGNNNFTIYVKQKDVKNFNLNIEIKNVSSSLFVAEHNNQVKSLRLVVPTNNGESVGETRAKNKSEAKNYQDAPTLTEPWHGGLPYEQIQQMADGQGAVCRYNLCSCPRIDDVAPVHVDNNNYFILLPAEELNEQILSCICKLETNQEHKPEIPDLSQSPIRENLAKPDGDKKLATDTTDLYKNFQSNQSEKTNDCMCGANQSLSDDGSVDKDENKCDCCSCSVLLPTNTCVCAQILASEFARCDQEIDIIVKEHAVIKKNPPIIKDAVTQTDWSGIVLEVRPRNDGSYEFHIPSLKYLKANNSLYR